MLSECRIWKAVMNTDTCSQLTNYLREHYSRDVSIVANVRSVCIINMCKTWPHFSAGSVPLLSGPEFHPLPRRGDNYGSHMDSRDINIRQCFSWVIKISEWQPEDTGHVTLWHVARNRFTSSVICSQEQFDTWRKWKSWR